MHRGAAGRGEDAAGREDVGAGAGSGIGDVCVIGAGFSGLAVGRALRGRGIPFTLVDRGEGVGGVWHVPAGERAGPTPGYRSLHLNTSRDATGFAGFPMPRSFPRFPRHTEVAAYLDDFARAHDFRRDIELRTEVLAVRPCAGGSRTGAAPGPVPVPAGGRRDGRKGSARGERAREGNAWEVISRNHLGVVACRRFRHLVVAAGNHWTPRLPEPGIAGSETFSGEIVHAVDYADAGRFAGRRVVVLGAGNSACDIAVNLSHTAALTILAMRRGIHVAPKTIMGVPVDEIAGSAWWTRLPLRVQQGLADLTLRIVRGPLAAYGLPEPDHRVFAGPLTISDDLLPRLSHGAIVVKPMIERFTADTAHFADGTHVRVDAVVYCTGYRMSLPFVPRDALFSDAGEVALYRRVVSPSYAGLYFAGLVRGVIRPVRALTRLFEAQAEWIADLVDGAAVLPAAGEMAAEIAAHLAVTRRHGTAAEDSVRVDVADHLRALRRERVAGSKRTPIRPGRPTDTGPSRAPV
ncbi:flavin-containing monooxygenase [Embleya sp. NPDC008237]|uniref:flavin-containing monooxygenase n=1 Tax=Embleya sp. NPDC008237 TaxID=3363978 RepID=UPI0036E32504